MSLFGLFKKKTSNTEELLQVKVDMHSHMLPGIDDGAKNLEESLEMIKAFKALGFRKLICTPHILKGHFDNSSETILPALEKVKKALEEQQIDIKIEAAAEHFYDEFFYDKLINNESLLSFGSNNYLLFETGFNVMPMNLTEGIAKMQSKGYFPVYAHPERYLYLQTDWEKVKKLYATGALFQVNAMSLAGQYGKAAQDLAEKLIDKEMVHFIGSDCHKMKHQATYQEVIASKYYQKAMELDLHNAYLG